MPLVITTTLLDQDQESRNFDICILKNLNVMGSATISFSFSVILSQPTTPFIIATYGFKSYNNDII